MTASREDSTVCPQHKHTAPSLQHICPQTLACSKAAVKALPTSTKNRWCFHIKELLRFLLKTKAPLLAPCWDRAGTHAPLRTRAHVLTKLDKTAPCQQGQPSTHSLTPAGLQHCTWSSLLPARGAQPQVVTPLPSSVLKAKGTDSHPSEPK